jgi:hypothetical protein
MFRPTTITTMHSWRKNHTACNNGKFRFATYRGNASNVPSLAFVITPLLFKSILLYSLHTFTPLTVSCSLISNSNAEKFGRNVSTSVCSLFAITQPYKHMAISFVFLCSHNSLLSLTFHFSAEELDILCFNNTTHMPFSFL